MSVVELTKNNFEQEVLASKQPVLIDFWADWCGPCNMQSPVIEEIAREYGDQFKICKVNVDEQPSIAMEYRIASIPTLVFMNHGMFQHRLIGFQVKDAIVETLKSLLDEE